MNSVNPTSSRVTARVRWELFLALVIGIGLCAWVFVPLEQTVSWIAACAYLVYLAVWSVAHIDSHKGPGGMHSKLGAGFWVTWFRAVGIAYLVGAVCGLPVFELSSVACFVVYAFVGLGDAIDGTAAKWSGTVSPFGARLDNQVDAFGMFAASLIAVIIEALPAYYLALSLAYFLFHFGMWLRERRGLSLYRDRMMQSLHNRYFAGVHMCLLAVALYPGVNTWALTIVASLGAVLLLCCFLRDWLYVCGTVTGVSDGFNKEWIKLASLVLVSGPLVARASVMTALLIGWPLGLPFWLLLLCMAVVVGWFARTSSWAVLLAIALGGSHATFDAAPILVAGLTWVAWLGSGSFSVSRMDDAVYFRSFSRSQP